MPETSFRAVLVPLDGSTEGEQAIPVGEAVARRAGATLDFAMVLQPPSALALSSELPRAAAEVEREARTHATNYLESRAEAARGAYGLAVTAALLDGMPAGALAGYVRAHGIDLVVMTTHGRGGLSRWWLGSVADQFLRRTPAPVLLLHPRESPQPTAFRRILVALDGETDEAVLEPALALGCLGRGTSYFLIRVVPPATPPVGALPAYSTRLGDWAKRQDIEARNRLARLAAGLRGRGIEVSTEVVPADRVAETLLDTARARSADLVVVGTHGAGPAERLILGSVADKVIRGAEQPVLVVPRRQA
jgi:nucleotide-binding universal stress UspA family protein